MNGRVCVCECVCERESVRARVCERERVCVCVCVRMKEMIWKRVEKMFIKCGGGEGIGEGEEMNESARDW